MLLHALGPSQRHLFGRKPILSSKVGLLWQSPSTLEIHCCYTMNTQEQILLAASLKLRGEPDPSPWSQMQRVALLCKASKGDSLGWYRTCCYLERERHCAFQQEPREGEPGQQRRACAFLLRNIISIRHVFKAA